VDNEGALYIACVMHDVLGKKLEPVYSFEITILMIFGKHIR